MVRKCLSGTEHLVIRIINSTMLYIILSNVLYCFFCSLIVCGFSFDCIKRSYKKTRDLFLDEHRHIGGKRNKDLIVKYILVFLLFSLQYLDVLCFVCYVVSRIGLIYRIIERKKSKFVFF